MHHMLPEQLQCVMFLKYISSFSVCPYTIVDVIHIIIIIILSDPMSPMSGGTVSIEMYYYGNLLKCF